VKAVIGAIVAVAVLSNASAAYSGGTNAESVKFIQYLDENTALEEVRNGNLDMYYYRISSDRIEGAQSKEGLKIYDSTGGSYSILVNPAESEEMNPFFYRDVRFALNYLVDRKLIVNELMGGYGVPMISNYGPFDPEYLAILDRLEEFQFRYNPKLAERMIAGALEANGAERVGGVWTHEGSPVTVTIFIRSDDPVRKSIGEILAAELEAVGFETVRDYGDLNKAFVVVYGSDPAENKWNLYTEGWGGRSAFVRYDPIGLAQMYSPWFSNMPGFNDPSYWNYQNEHLDEITQKIYSGDFRSEGQRNELIQRATVEAISESVRVFLASKIDQYAVNESVEGVINDFGAGVPTRFTPINARGGGPELTVGVKQIYQGAWNPVRGFTDSYSSHIWNPINDPAAFKHPFTGDTIPIRGQWKVETGGPDRKIGVPGDAITWDSGAQAWADVGDAQATSKVTFDLKFSKWHNGVQMDMNDILHAVYFTLEWGTMGGGDDRTFDSEYTPQTSQIAEKLVGIRPLSESQIEVYVDYWHFDDGEIAGRAAVWSSMPWEIYASMEKAVLDGKASFSRSGSVSKNVSWLSLIVPNDSRIIRQNLEEFMDGGFVPNALREFQPGGEYLGQRYGSSIGWIDQRNHAVISNGPFYLESYAPESRTITLRAFDDPGYPFGRGHWAQFEDVSFPAITKIDVPSIIAGSDGVRIDVETENASEIRYFVSNEDGIVQSGAMSVESDAGVIEIRDGGIRDGTNSIKVFAVSEDVLRPDFYETSFIIAGEEAAIGQVSPIDFQGDPRSDGYWVYGMVALAGIIGAAVLIRGRLRSQAVL